MDIQESIDKSPAVEPATITDQPMEVKFDKNLSPILEVIKNL